MWKCIFNSITKRGAGINRPAGVGEFAIDLEPSVCAWFNVTPVRYHFVNGQLAEFPGWAAEQAAEKLAADQALMKDAIKGKEAQRNNRKIEHPQIAGKFFEPSAKIDRIIGRSDALANTDPLPTNGGCFDDVDEVPVPMTVGQLKKLRNAIIDREEANYVNRKFHITEMKKLADPLTYDYTGGWS